MERPEYGLFDCDTHCYEPRDCFTRHLPAEMAERTMRTVDIGGQERILADRRIAVLATEQVDQFDFAFRPGSLKEMLRQMASGNPEETYQPVPMRPEWVSREPRVELMREQGVDKAIIFPGTMALTGLHYLDDPAVLYANLRSFNQWFDETWGFNYQDRLYATPLLSLRDRDLAVQETDRLIEAGARLVLLPSGPVGGRSPGDPYFDPIWSRLNEAGVRLAFHIMPTWELRSMSPAWGHNPDPPIWQMSAWQWLNVWGDRVIESMLSAIIFDNLFGRFPNLMAIVAEHGADWVPGFVRHMDKARGMGRSGPWLGGKLKERPSEVFHRHVRVTPYPEDDVPRIVAELNGRVESLVMGSDYPHAEGVAEPWDFLKALDTLDEGTQRQIMWENARSLFAGS